MLALLSRYRICSPPVDLDSWDPAGIPENKGEDLIVIPHTIYEAAAAVHWQVCIL